MIMEIFVSVIFFFVGIAVLVLIHICIVERAFGGGYQNGHDMSQNSSSSSSDGAKLTSNEDLMDLPCFDYKAEGSSPVACVVCLENFKVRDTCRLLTNCNHIFHAQCIDSWLLKNPICPICRTCVTRKIRDEETGDSVAIEIELP